MTTSENGQSDKKRKFKSFQNELIAVRSLVQIRIVKLKRSMRTKATSVFKDPDVTETMSSTHDKYVVVPADKSPNNIVLICKSITLTA